MRAPGTPRYRTARVALAALALGPLLASCAALDLVDPGQTTWEAEDHAEQIEGVLRATLSTERDMPAWLGGQTSVSIHYVVDSDYVLDDPTRLVVWSLETAWSLRKDSPDGGVRVLVTYLGGGPVHADWAAAVSRLPGDWAGWRGDWTRGELGDEPEHASFLYFSAPDSRKVVTGDWPVDSPPPPDGVFVLRAR